MIKEATKTKDTPKIPRKRDSKLNTRQRAFVKAFSDPNSKTFGNQTKSYQSVYKGVGNDIAASAGSRLLNNVKVNTEIEAAFQKSGLTDMVISDKLSDVLLGRYKKHTVTLNKDKQVITETIADPSVNELVKVSEAIWKVRGVYDKNKAQVQVAEKEYSKLMKDVFNEYRECKTK